MMTAMTAPQFIFGTLLSLGGGFLGGYGAVYVLNHIPASWLCDYDEKPDERHLPPRIARYPWAPLFALVLATATMKSALVFPTYGLAVLIALWLLLQIGIADWKYRIIPDQHVILLGISAIGFTVFHHSFWSPLSGLLLGGGIMLAIGLVGKFALKKETMGFGDVKLMAVCGLITGLTGIVIVFLLTALSSAAVFSIWLTGGKIRLSDTQPLGPFIAGATAIYLIFAEEINHLLFLWLGLAG